MVIVSAPYVAMERIQSQPVAVSLGFVHSQSLLPTGLSDYAICSLIPLILSSQC